MIKAVVAGACGKMGQRVLWALSQDRDFQVVGAFERPGHPDIGKDPGLVAGIGELGLKVEQGLDDIEDLPDVLIDFTTPQCSLANLRWASTKNVAMVIGTTGFSKEEGQEAKRLARDIRCVMAPNMSVGVNLMFYMAKKMAQILGDDFDVEILEVHHRLKKDAPSGTALRLAQVVAEALGRDLEKVGVYERKGIIGQRSREEIGIQTFRAGDITGEHTLLFGGIGERLELIHRAHSRDTFAKGAVRAAKWLLNQPPGLYDMQDVLGLKE